MVETRRQRGDGKWMAQTGRRRFWEPGLWDREDGWEFKILREFSAGLNQ